MVLIWSPRFQDHKPPSGHPESPERARVMAAAAERWRASGGEVVAPRTVSHEQLLRVHDEAHIEAVLAATGRAVSFDQDTFTGADSVGAALLAAGAAVDLVEHVLGDTHPRAFALVRPPGHHAERNRAMGFCLFNNIAVAAAHARAIGAARVAIVDYDVHHGNGTQHIFEDDPSVLYVSTHQFPHYPGTGAAKETGVGRGAGFTVNVPLRAGATDEVYQKAFDETVLPAVRTFAPDILLVSAGFDAHERDPLANMRVTTSGFRAMTEALRDVADECCDGRVGFITEGGYDLQALDECLSVVVDVLGTEFRPKA
jgi:acetoin utilization deacetylase AcuC-like enzyme